MYKVFLPMPTIIFDGAIKSAGVDYATDKEGNVESGKAPKMVYFTLNSKVNEDEFSELGPMDDPLLLGYSMATLYLYNRSVPELEKALVEKGAPLMKQARITVEWEE
jgi:hypothetical protein